jgi:hypothetical protein
VKDFPLTLDYRLSLAACLFWQGLLTKGDTDATLRLMNESIALLDEELTRRPDPGVKGVRDTYAESRDAIVKARPVSPTRERGTPPEKK